MDSTAAKYTRNGCRASLTVAKSRFHSKWLNVEPSRLAPTLPLSFLYPCDNLYLPMDDILNHERKRKWFVWGMVVTCTLSIPLIIGMSNAFRGISKEKATGLAPVAGGCVLAFVNFFGGVFFSLSRTTKTL